MATSIITVQFRTNDAPGDVSPEGKPWGAPSVFPRRAVPARRDMGKSGKTAGLADSAGTRSGPD